MDFPGDGALLLDRGLQVLGQLGQTPFRGCQLGAPAARAPGLVHLQARSSTWGSRAISSLSR
jgi:hypothetical protein